MHVVYFAAVFCPRAAVTQEEMALAARRMSVAPGRSSNVPPPPRKYSGHHGSMFWSKSLFEGTRKECVLCSVALLNGPP